MAKIKKRTFAIIVPKNRREFREERGLNEVCESEVLEAFRGFLAKYNIQDVFCNIEMGDWQGKTAEERDHQLSGSLENVTTRKGYKLVNALARHIYNELDTDCVDVHYKVNSYEDGVWSINQQGRKREGE
ncbi:MAG: hypothetical protein ACOX2O_09020 [Bdellovibrionota bacterium]|jgi:hypothetical protein